jgi:serine/threonine-protein kinase
MDPNRWTRRKSIFAAAAELPPDQRPAFLARECDDDDELRAEVQELLDQLSADDRTANLLPKAPPPESIRPGEVLASRFRIIRLLGRGGMGEVYEADDLELGGRIALKTLRPEIARNEQFLQRFKREVNLARQITHPNICRVFDVGFDGGQAFLTMELLRGRSLAERIRQGPPLSRSEIRRYAKEILEAVAAAHSRRITHRDLKPGNITITEDGSVKIVDFGLAKSLQPLEVNSVEDTAVMAQETRAGVVLGTPGYMSPEQALGRPVDERSDLFSVGAVLYEMVTGRRPFGSGHQNEIIARLVTEQPEPARQINPDLDPALEFVIDRCLEKDRNKRFASAEEALQALRTGDTAISSNPAPALPDPSRRTWIRYAAGGGAVAVSAAAGFGLWKYIAQGGSIESLAVLPLINEGPPENEFLTDGFTESLINEVSTGDLRVIARSAVYRFNRKEDPLEVARKLGVAAVLTGRLLYRNSNLLTLSLELTSVASLERLWGKRIDLLSSALQTLQSKIATEVLAALRVRRRANLPAMQVAAVDPAAYELYLKGRYQWNKRTPAAQQRAVEYLQQAMEIAPGYAPVHAALADVFAFQSGFKPSNEVFPRSLASARRALELDPNLADAHAALAFSQLHFEWNWSAAEASCRRALELNPSYPSAHSYYGRLLTSQKRFDEAITQYQQAQSLDPLSPAVGVAQGLTYFYARRYADAAQALQRVISLEKNFSAANPSMAVVRLVQGDTAGAISLLEQALTVNPNDTGVIADLGLANGLAGNAAKAREAVARLQKIAEGRYVLPYFFALPHLGMGDRKTALDFIERALEERCWPVPYIGVDPKLDALRAEPRFQTFVRERLHLPA